MKKFDKGYIYCGLLSDLFSSLVIVFFFFDEIFLEDSSKAEDIIATLPVFAIAFAVIYLCFIIYRILYYKTSGYELTETEIKCTRGVLFRKRSILDYKKVHAINKKQNLIHRIFGIAVLTVDSGSTNTSQQAEITIVEKSKTVDSLVNELNVLKENGIKNNVNTSEEELLLSNNDSLYRFTSKKKMLYTLINIVSTAFFIALFGILAIIVIGVCKLMLENNSIGSWGEYFLLAILITIGGMLLFSAFSFIISIIHSFIGYYKFNITKCGNNIQISFGLLEKHTNTFSYDRIKAVKISQGLVQRMLGFASIKLEVIGYTNNTQNDTVELGVLVPFCKYSEIDEILGKVLPDYIPDKKQTNAVSLFPFVSWFLLIFGIIISMTLLLTVAIMLILNVPTFAVSIVAVSVLGVSALILLVKLISAILNYKTNGIAIADNKITAYYGGFTKNITVFKTENLIAVEDVTTPLRKKCGIASLVMHLKTNALSNELKVHIQKDMLTEELGKMLIL